MVFLIHTDISVLNISDGHVQSTLCDPCMIILFYSSQTHWGRYRETAVRFSAGTRILLILQRVHPGPGTHPVSYSMGIGGTSGVKWPWREAYHSSHLVATLRLDGDIVPPSHMSSGRN